MLNFKKSYFLERYHETQAKNSRTKYVSFPILYYLCKFTQKNRFTKKMKFLCLTFIFQNKIMILTFTCLPLTHIRGRSEASWLHKNLGQKIPLYTDIFEQKINTVERLWLRPQICLNLMPVSICLHFRLIVYYV